jgi:hypothetical protein
MPNLLSEDLVITGTYSLSDNTQIGPNAKVTVKPGAVLDLGRYQLENFGTLSLEGSASSFATLRNGTYNAEMSASGQFTSSWSVIENLSLEDWGGYGTLDFENSVFKDSFVEALPLSSILNSLFIDSTLKASSTDELIIDTVTFKDSTYRQGAWITSENNGPIIKNSNFIGESPLIYLDPFFGGPGTSHNLRIQNSYVNVGEGQVFDDLVYDSNDDFSVSRDLKATDFVEDPITNSSGGFTVGTYSVSTGELRGGSAGDTTLVVVTSEISLIVNRGVLSPEPVYLTNLKESVSYSGSTVVSTLVEYGGLSFDFETIDSLVTVVLRNSEFTAEFRSEIVAFAPSASNLSYSDAVLLVGESQIEARLVAIAGADGNYVG